MGEPQRVTASSATLRDVDEAGNRTIRCVGGLVYDPNGALLLVRRGHEPGKGLWSIPGGRVEPGESDAEAVVRELAEETGLVVAPGRLVGSVRRPGARPGTEYEIFDYACTATGGTPRPGDDADALTWADAAAFTQLADTGALVPLLADTLTTWSALPR
jgi:8-oxo-dGTP diphosphatase